MKYNFSMKKIILFSVPLPQILDRLLLEIFPEQIENKIFAYMPSDGSDEISNEKFTPVWRSYGESRGVKEFYVIDNSKTKDSSINEYNQILKSNILVITGGNTFTLLRNLKRSGLDEAVKKFSQKDEFVLAGFSAGALVLTPNIEICNLVDFDNNLVDLKDLNALNLINYEVFPHFNEEHRNSLNEYQRQAKNEVKTITNEEIIVLNCSREKSF